MRQLEKPIENQILNLLKLLGVYCWKNPSVGMYDKAKGVYRKSNNKHHINGVADIIGVISGRFLAIEVKSKTGTLSQDQKLFIMKVNEEGGVAFVARSPADVLKNLSLFFPDNIKFKAMYDRHLTDCEKLQ